MYRRAYKDPVDNVIKSLINKYELPVTAHAALHAFAYRVQKLINTRGRCLTVDEIRRELASSMYGELPLEACIELANWICKTSPSKSVKHLLL